MNKKVDKTLENLIDKMMKETKLETPSLDFTSQVMSQVEVISQSDVTTYKPLISKKVWLVLIAGIVGTLVYSLFTTTTESSWLSSVDLSVLTNNSITDALSSVTFSKTLMYAVLLFAVMFAVQIPLLKGHFNKRFSV